MKFSNLIFHLSFMLTILNCGAFLRDFNIIKNTKEKLYNISEIINDTYQNDGDLLEVIPNGIVFESEVKNDTLFYSLKTRVNLCFSIEKIVLINRTYFKSYF